MDRRGFLIGAGVTLASSGSGCLGDVVGPGGGEAVGTANAPRARLSMAAVTDSQLPSRVLESISTDGTREDRLFERILDGGATISETRPPFREDRHLLYDNTVYRLSYEVVSRTPATSYRVRIDFVEETATDSGTVRFEALPEVDRQKLTERNLDQGTPGIRTTVVYSDAERNRSALVPDPRSPVIRWQDGTRGRWVVTETSGTTVRRYRYTAERVASATEYGQRMRDRFAFELRGLSDAQRDIVSVAISDGEYVVGPEETPSATLRSLIDEFRARGPVRAIDEQSTTRRGGLFLVEYEGELYWTEVRVRGESVVTDAAD